MVALFLLNASLLWFLSTSCSRDRNDEEEFDSPVWIERFPSQSNPSDILSRETVTKFEEAEKVKVDPWEMWSLLTEVDSHFPTLKKSAAALPAFWMFELNCT